MPDSLLDMINSTIKEAVRNNMIYPEISQELGDQGSVYIQCIIESDGTITDIMVVRGVSLELDHEALRVIRSIPPFDFFPKDTRYNRVRMRFPVIFTLH